MPSFDIAHVREQDTNIIIVVVGESFGEKTKDEQSRIVDVLQICAGRAGLMGTVVPVWEKPADQMGYVAPAEWHRYFDRLRYVDVQKNINRRLVCGQDGEASVESIPDERPVVV